MNLLVNVSVIISTYSENRLKNVLECVESLKRQSMLPYEIILALDQKPCLVEFYRAKLSDDARIVVSRGVGLSNARNAGVKSARGEVIAFIDDDAVANVDWIRNLAENYHNPEVVGVGGYIAPVWEEGCPVWFPAELNWVVGCSYKGLPEHRATVRNPIGCNMSFRRDVFDAVGYFRTDVGRFGKVLLGSEEPEISFRILMRFPASKIIYEPSAVVYHKVGKNRTRLAYLLRRSFYEGVSKAMIFPPNGNSDAGLAAENQYLKYLIKVAVPSKAKHIYRFDGLSQLVTLFLSTGAVLLGFFVGRLGGNRIHDL